MHGYGIAGLSVESDIALPGLIARPLNGEPPDVWIRQAPVPANLENPDASGPTWEMSGDRFLLRIPGIVRFLLTGGRVLAFAPEGPVEDVRAFLLGTAFGILLHQRGAIVLHASAVKVGGKAVVFCGASGAGKSTIAAALGQRGYPLVTDDVGAVSFDSAGTPVIYPDGRQLKLWAHAIAQLGFSRGEAVRDAIEKFYVEPREVFGEAMPLGAIYALREARPPIVPGIERPNVVDASLLLRRNAYRPLLVQRMGRRADYFYAATAIAGHAGIFHLSRPLDFSELPAGLDGLERHWRETGLTEKPS
ncbi:hypothetical protein [Rhizomicrobium electricum]|jgi:hypothetical protein|uniref:HPr kinase n=1 Tax=Rhizomicrobium electricum TaxID=480070 RepID=A0ABP3PCT5_9PROT|nr:hypothetical protein [Rhizomicrobium electricum]NIJ48648.1 hypothetical protein [Rhizomicrobium electricum]